MPESAPTDAPAVTWRVRVVRRVAGSVGAAVVIAGVAPALANAAGADVANPVAIALRASGRGIQSALSTSSDATVAECKPSDAPVVAEPLVVPDETTSVEPSAEPTAAPSVEPSAEPVTPSVEPSVAPTEVVASETAAESAAPAESVVPTEEVVESVAPSAEPTDCESEAPAESATPEASESSEEPEDGESDGEHGKIVSTVAKCAPKGKDPLLAVEGAPGNHGAFVKPAAHGESLTTPWGTFDLSTQAGADELCAAVAAARAALPAETAKQKGKSGEDHGKAGKERGKPAKDKAAKGHGKGGDKAGKNGSAD